MATIPTSSSIAGKGQFWHRTPATLESAFRLFDSQLDRVQSVFHDSELRQSVVNMFKKNNDTLCLFNIAMENGPFIDGLLLKWWFSMAMLNNQMVIVFLSR